MPWTERHFPEQTPETDSTVDGFVNFNELCMINDILRMTKHEEQNIEVIDTAAPL